MRITLLSLSLSLSLLALLSLSLLPLFCGLHSLHSLSSNSQVPTPRNPPSLSLFVPLFSPDYLKLADFSRVFLLRHTTHPMLCSSPATKSSSNWLDRLRSIKGIPTGDDLDLDSFLSSHSSSNSDPTIFPPKRDRNLSRGPELSAPDADPPSMSSVLAELFNMGGSLSQSSKLSGKKCPRKQTNPKSFVASRSNSRIIDCARKEEKNVPCTNYSSNNLVLETKEDNMACWDEEEEEEDKEKENGGNELKGFSKSEVTVIDTSCPEWKVDKFVFRKNNVWKVREKKGKSKVFGKKKRKGSLGFDKKLKILESQFGSSVETNAEEFVMRSTPGQNTQKEMKDGSEDRPEEDPKSPPKKRVQFSGSLGTPRKENKSVIIIKTIPT